MAGGLRWTEEQLAEYEQRRKQTGSVLAELREARHGSASDSPPVLPADPGPEGDLQQKIEKWCEDHAFPFFHDRSRKVNVPGFPDLVIALRDRRTLWIELKSRGGRLDPEQKKWRLKLLALGHEWYEIRSYKRFLEVVAGP